jgi:Flp pilus assembly protein TadG
MLTRFACDARATVAMFFALALLPLCAFMGAALDYTRAADARTQLQAAVDATALAVAHQPDTITDSDFAAMARSFFDSDFSASDVGAVLDSFSATRSGNTVEVAASGHLASTLLGVTDPFNLGFTAAGTAALSMKKVEIALVLDNTGSMADDNKMTELQAAANNLIDTLSTIADADSKVWISVVPFDTQVRIPTSLASEAWLYFDTTGAKLGHAVSSSTWTGCLTDRDQPYDTNDTVPDLGTYSPSMGTTTKYLADRCTQSSLTTMLPLTDDFTALHDEINAMTPTGNTNITIGIQLGLATLSPTVPFDTGASYGDDTVEKFMILLTDGDNTQDRWSSCGFRSCAIDSRTTSACKAVKAAGDITLYTVRVMDGNATLLQNCASSTDKYFNVTTASQLGPVFQHIADEITALRLTS